MNAANQLTLIRDFLNESVAKHWSDRMLLSCLNMAQGRQARKISKSAGGWLLTSTNVTPADSVITLPTDCSKPVYLEETTSGYPIPFQVDVYDRRMSRQPSAQYHVGQLEAYPQIGVVVVNKESYTTACTLWYQLRVPDLHVGTASAGGAASITLSAYDGVDAATGFGASVIADYYNNSKFQVVEGTGAGAPDTITDYSAARVAAVTGTYGATSDYGTISRLPEECHLLMAIEAVIIAIAKPSSALDPKYFEYLKSQWKDQNDEFLTWIADWKASRKGVRTTEIE
jgi:hypothetical protein